VNRSAFAVRLPPTFDFVVTRRRDRWSGEAAKRSGRKSG